MLRSWKLCWVMALLDWHTKDLILFLPEPGSKLCLPFLIVCRTSSCFEFDHVVHFMISFTLLIYGYSVFKTMTFLYHILLVSEVVFSHLVFWLFRFCTNKHMLVSLFFSGCMLTDKCRVTESYEPVNSTWTSERCAVCRMVEDWHHNKMIICNRYNFLVLFSSNDVAMCSFCFTFRNPMFDTWGISLKIFGGMGYLVFFPYPLFSCIEWTFLFHWLELLAWWYRCQVAVHEECYGVKASESVGSWVCSACVTPDVERECCLCPVRG